MIAAYQAWPKTGKRSQLNLERNTLRQAAHRLPYPQSRWVAALIIFNKMEKYVIYLWTKAHRCADKVGKGYFSLQHGGGCHRSLL